MRQTFSLLSGRTRACRLASLAALVLGLSTGLAAPRQVEVPPPATAPKGAQSFPTLEAIRTSIADKEKALEKKQAEIDQPRSSEARLALLEQSRALQAELDVLRADFESVATGIDTDAFNLGRRKELDLKSELEKLLAPIIEELKDATESPRQIEELRTQLAYFEERQALARQAIGHIDGLLAAGPEEALRAELEESKAAWQQRNREIENQATVARYQLDTRLQNRTSVIDSTRRAVADFFRTRGLNLLLAIATFLAVFLGLRWLYGLIRRVSPIHKRAERPFYARILDVLYHGFTGLAALVGSMLVLYAAGDWVLLGVMLFFLVGLAWASKTTLPQFVDQIRILLNLGTVRELERVVYNGLPWRVSRLSFYTILSNPELSGGIVRLPVKQLTEMRSRPCAADDVWFPSHRGDWVRLSDGKLGLVLHQSPEAVRLRTLGGSVITYQTLDYLGLSPENLSGGFTVSVTFGIDYAHQAISTTRVPEVMRERLEAGLRLLVTAEDLTKLGVEFQAAAASSLDFMIFASFRGAVAERIRSLERLIQRILVETCNAEGWGIPFPQLMIHQASETGSASETGRASEPQRPQSSR